MPIYLGDDSRNLKKLYCGSQLLVGGATAPGKEPIAYFPYEDNIDDLLGNIPTPTSSYLTYTKSSIGYDLTYTGGTDLLMPAALASARTMSIRVKWKSDGSGNYIKVSTPALSAAMYCFRHWQSSPNNAREVCDDNGCYFSPHKNLSQNTWYHIVIVYDGTYYQCYINGSLSQGNISKSLTTTQTWSFIRHGTLEYSRLLYDAQGWDSNDVTSYYGSTKSIYGY